MALVVIGSSEYGSVAAKIRSGQLVNADENFAQYGSRKYM